MWMRTCARSKFDFFTYKVTRRINRAITNTDSRKSNFYFMCGNQNLSLKSILLGHPKMGPPKHFSGYANYGSDVWYKLRHQRLNSRYQCLLLCISFDFFSLLSIDNICTGFLQSITQCTHSRIMCVREFIKLLKCQVSFSSQVHLALSDMV